MRYFVDVFRLVYRWFFRYPVIGGVLALLLWIVSFNGLSGLGVPDLFWRIASSHSFFAGVGVALVFSIAIYIAYVIDSEELGHDLVWYEARTYPVLFIIFAIGLWRNRHPFGVAAFLGWLTGAITLLIARVLLMKLAKWIAPIAHPGRRAHAAIKHASINNVHLHIYALLVLLILGLAYVLMASVRPLY